MIRVRYCCHVSCHNNYPRPFVASRSLAEPVQLCISNATDTIPLLSINTAPYQPPIVVAKPTGFSSMKLFTIISMYKTKYLQ